MKAFDAVHDSQRVFRALLRSTSRPGEIVALPETGDGAVESVLLTLLDVEGTFCVLGPDRMRELEERLLGATGARPAPVEEADFALIPGGDSDGAMLDLRRGTLEAPETGATAIYGVKRLAEGGPKTLTLSGPGVSGSRTLGVEGLSAEELEAIRESRAYYPLGVDVYLVNEAGSLVGLPRSTRIERGG